MNCPLETRGNTELLEYVSGGLSETREGALEGHLAECPACREFVRGQQSAWRALELWEAPPVSADFDRRLRQRIAEESTWWERLLRPFGVRQLLPVAASAALLVAAGVLIERPPAPPPVAAHVVTVEMEALQPDQVVQALDEMDALSEFNHSLKADSAEPRM